MTVQLTARGKQIRRDTYQLSKANGGYHYGGCFSVVEILTALYDRILNSNDAFILSKGHACWPWYTLLRETGWKPKLEGHPHRDPYNGILATTGSLGHGLPVGVGIALAKKQQGDEGRVFVVMGDGECQEGTTWEALLIAGHHRLNNLYVIVDWNGIQGSRYTKNTLIYTSSVDAAAALAGWATREVSNGHDVEEIVNAITRPRSRVLDEYGRPLFILAKTIKGAGVSFMEDSPAWHAKWPNADEEKQILKELAE